MRTRHHSRLAAAVALALLLAACGGDDATDTTTADTSAGATTEAPTATAPEEPPVDVGGVPPTDYEGFRNQPVACGGEAPPAATPMQFDAPEDLGIDPASRPVATLVTSCGDIVIELDPSTAPETVNSFVFLAEEGYFDGTVSHRVVPGFVFQAGDPDATGMGGPGYSIPDELPQGDFSYASGVVAMANAGPGTTGSQFFITLTDVALPPSYSVLGQVTSGSETLEAIAAVPTGVGPSGEPSTPLQTIYLETVTIER